MCVQVSFWTVQQLMDVKRELMPALRRNRSNAAATDAYSAFAPDSYKTGASRLQVHPFDASRMTSAGAVPRSSNLNDAICMTSCGASPSPHRARSDCRSGRFLDIPWQSKGPAHPFILFTRPPGKAETVLGRRTR